LEDIQRDYQTKGKNPKPGKFFTGGPKWGMENAMFFNILVPMGKRRNTVYKEASKL
jgi:hypothetical protein